MGNLTVPEDLVFAVCEILTGLIQCHNSILVFFVLFVLALNLNWARHFVALFPVSKKIKALRKQVRRGIALAH